MERKLINYIPPYEQDFLELRQLFEAEQPEIDDLWTAAETALADQFIMDASELSVSRWESMIGISPKGTDTLDERKFRILTQLNQELPYTMKALEQALINLCGANNFRIALTAAEYRIEVKLAMSNENNYGEVETLLKKMIPANMTQYIQIMYNGNNVLAHFPHEQLSAYTHDQLRKEVFE